MPDPRHLLLVGLAACLTLTGCGGGRFNRTPTPAAAGLNTRDLIDPNAQGEFERRADLPALLNRAERVREEARPAHPPPKRSALCLSGGGSYGAYSAGVLCGWTCRRDRPNFDVVTGISTGALIAPFAFLGPRYDGELKRFYTTTESRDIYRTRPVRGLVSEALADNAPLAETIDHMLTPQVVAEIAQQHRCGRRLYVGTTELEGKRFVMWDVGAIACRGTPADRELIKLILLGSSAIPGFFPPARIPVEVEGRPFVELHVDGGVSRALFFHPPYVPPELAGDKDANSLWDLDVYAVVAGKLYPDPQPTRPRSLQIAERSISTVLYAQTRGDLMTLWTTSQLSGMNFRMTAIPESFPAPESSTDFCPADMTRMFDEGFRLGFNGTAWRQTPPGVEFGEVYLARDGTRLIHQPRGPTGPAATLGGPCGPKR